MYLKKFIYINWGNIPNSECEFGPINLFSGGNGSGKTTAADAIQTIMTAAHDSLFHFNPGQDESSQRGRGGKQVRTLASYVLGCDDGAYARPDGCDGYLGAVFYPTPGEDGQPFTALIGMRAFIEGAGQQRVARLDDTQFFILPDISLSLSDLLKEDKAGRYVLPLDRVHAQLRRQFSSQAVEKYDKKKSYLCRFYGALRGRQDAVSEREAINAARAFSRFMAYKPIKGIDEFVATEVLEPRDLGEAIRTVSSMLKRIHTMEADARQIQEAVERLAQGLTTTDTYIQTWLEWQLAHYGLARRRYNDCQFRYLTQKNLQQELRDKLSANSQAVTVCEQRREELQAQILDVNTRRLGVPALRDKDQLEKDKAAQEKAIHASVPDLLTGSQQLQAHTEAASEIQQHLSQVSLELAIPALAEKNLKQLLKSVASDDRKIDVHGLLNRDWIDLSPLEDTLSQAREQQQQHNQLAAAFHGERADGQERLRDQLAAEAGKRQRTMEQAQKQSEALQRDIDALSTQQVSYPPFVRAALAAIQQQCPQADARVLCDYVEIVAPDWQSALEGYIGGARFGIIVEPEYEAEAIRLVRNLSGGSKARVIQGDKARRDCERMSSLPADSVIHLMQFSHATAEYYLKASYGQVLQVSDAEALRGVRRGVTRDAMGSGNYAMFRCDIPDTDLVFGQGARERALAAKQAALILAQKEWQAADELAQRTRALVQAVDRLKPVQVADQLQTMRDAQRRSDAIDKQLEQLDLGDSEALEQELAELKALDKACLQEYQALNEERVKVLAQQANVDDKCRQLDSEQDRTLATVDQCEAALEGIGALWPEFDSETRLAAVDDDLRDTGYYENQLPTLSGELKASLNRLQQNLMQHNQFSRSADAMAFELDYTDELSRKNFAAVCDLRRQYDALYNRHKNNILAQRHAELGSLRESFNNAFVSDLCHVVYQSINDGKKVLENLNAELEHHRFGADRERFRFGWDWVPEYKEYWQFFKAVMDNPSLREGDNLFDIPLEPKHQRVRERLMAMLLSDDEQQALRELTRMSDYRNYRRYEIYKEPEGKPPIALSQYGTGSGGQLETPAYIIRSAAITSAFRFNEGSNHLRMVLVDEAFSKMDEHRSREVINYLTESLGLQLLFIMPSSKSGPFMDLISNQFVFSKCPTAERVGELNSRVILDRQTCDQAQIEKLMANHRRTIRQQAELEFLSEVE
ncbi:ATP-binding protein [Marinimicrobium alkaliphilum]|uniref:ATP-binding protein n=1 Tax=Marinimicrobium alkaliphilum TaxID=2202654 RepID=UPI000DB9D413|nr:SbcC/MukB-like Walker B domain-containing protein [Marinimicrobium alkaliphilum]